MLFEERDTLEKLCSIAPISAPKNRSCLRTSIKFGEADSSSIHSFALNDILGDHETIDASALLKQAYMLRKQYIKNERVDYDTLTNCFPFSSTVLFFLVIPR